MIRGQNGRNKAAIGFLAARKELPNCEPRFGGFKLNNTLGWLY